MPMLPNQRTAEHAPHEVREHRDEVDEPPQLQPFGLLEADIAHEHDRHHDDEGVEGDLVDDALRHAEGQLRVAERQRDGLAEGAPEARDGSRTALLRSSARHEHGREDPAERDEADRDPECDDLADEGDREARQVRAEDADSDGVCGPEPPHGA
jgi:hypothetical protein